MIFRRAQYAIKRSVDSLRKKVGSLTSQLMPFREKLSTMSEESLNDKLDNLNIPEGEATVIKECVAAAKCTSKKNWRYSKERFRNLSSIVSCFKRLTVLYCSHTFMLCMCCADNLHYPINKVSFLFLLRSTAFATILHSFVFGMPIQILEDA